MNMIKKRLETHFIVPRYVMQKVKVYYLVISEESKDENPIEI